jgi:hypothetical protein
MSSDKILGLISRFEFLVEWLITSKYPNDINIFHQFLVLIEAIKFYYRIKKLTHTNMFILDDAVQEQKTPFKFTLP